MTGYTQNLTLTDWNAVREYLDNSVIHFSGSFVDKASSGKYPKDAFTLGQIISKVWLLETLKDIDLSSKKTVAILGAWIATLAEPLCKQHSNITRIYGIDSDPVSVELSDHFNQQLVQSEWRYKGVVADVNLLYMNNLILDISGSLIEAKPDIIVNTSCEHMDDEWFTTVDNDQLLIIQSNNSPDYDGHINICDNIDDFKQKYQLSQTLFIGSLQTPAYTRFMCIGYK